VGVAQDGRAEGLRADAVLVAAGRRPRVGGFGLERLGVTWDRDGIRVDDRMRTAAPDVYAAGDVTAGPRFTHVGGAEGWAAGRNAAGGGETVDHSAMPRVTFTEPEVASVGLTEDEARAVHRGVEVAVHPLTGVDRARILGQTRGHVKLVTASRRVLGRTGGGRLVGAHVVGPSAGELVNDTALVMRTKAFVGRLAQSTHAYPTMGMALQQAAFRLFPEGAVLIGEGAREDAPANDMPAARSRSADPGGS